MPKAGPQPDEITADHKPWDQQPGENDASYQLFCIWRDMPYGRRTARAVAEAANRSINVVNAASKTHRWQQRGRAYRADIEMQRRREMQADIRAMARRHAKTAQAAVALAAEALKEHLQADRLTPTEAIRLLEVGSKVERLALLGYEETDPLQAPPGGEPVDVSVGRILADPRLIELAHSIVLGPQQPQLPDIVIDSDNDAGDDTAGSE